MKSVKHLDQDFELNLAPIIDCFVVLITYLLVSAAFLSLGILDVGIAVTGEPNLQDSNVLNPLTLIVDLGNSSQVHLKLIGGSDYLDWGLTIEPKGGKRDIDSLMSRLTDIKVKYPALKELSLTAHPDVNYDEVVKLIEMTQKLVPKVYLAQ